MPDTKPDTDGLKNFLLELAALSHKYQLGLAGEIQLFEMESDDEARKYFLDDEDGRLNFR